MIQQIQNTKAKALIHHIIQYFDYKSDSITLTKLYQLLYLIDFGHYALHGDAVSDLDYLKYNASLFAIGAESYIKFPQPEHSVLELKEPVTSYDASNISTNFKETTLDIIQKTLHFFNDYSTKHIAKIIAYHPSWVLTQSGDILSYHLASHCDFECLGYYANEKTNEDIDELKKERLTLENNETIKSLMARIQKIKRAV